MINDRRIRISVAPSKNSINWVGTEMMWSTFVDKLKTPLRTEETYDAYIPICPRASKAP